MDTAAVMTTLDLVIMSDTAVAHLTESLGVPGWITLSASPMPRALPSATTIRATPAMRIFPGDLLERGPGFDRIGVVLRRWDIEAAKKRPTMGRN